MAAIARELLLGKSIRSVTFIPTNLLNITLSATCVKKKFGEIWTDTSNKILAGLKDRKPLLQGRCATCKFLNCCNGNFRTRAEAVTGNFWASDPACYLTDEEIS